MDTKETGWELSMYMWFYRTGFICLTNVNFFLSSVCLSAGWSISQPKFIQTFCWFQSVESNAMRGVRTYWMLIVYNVSCSLPSWYYVKHSVFLIIINSYESDKYYLIYVWLIPHFVHWFLKVLPRNQLNMVQMTKHIPSLLLWRQEWNPEKQLDLKYLSKSGA